MQLRTPFSAGRDRKGDRTRERLFQAALDEFRASGFENASIGRIAERAGTSRASFYFYFPSKDTVLLELQWRVEAAVVEATRDAPGLREFLTVLVEELCRVEVEVCTDGLLRAMLGVYIRRPAEIDLTDQPFPLMIEVARRFAAGRDTELRRGLEPAQATELFLSALFGLIAGSAGPVAERRADLLQLASLFLEGDALRC